MLRIGLPRMTDFPDPPRPSMNRVRLGLIGCGAITENAHLPAALASPLVDVTVLSDANVARLDSIRRCFGLHVNCYADYRAAFDQVDAVILALPNHLHASIGCEFLSRGIHVLCEKPLAVSVAECEQMCSAASGTGAILSVGYVTRFYPSTELTLRLIRGGLLGRLGSIDYEFGTAGGWSPLSGYTMSRGTCGGGVLVVSGSHFLDRMLYLFGEPRVLEYADDSRGGVEANCVARFELTHDSAVFSSTVTLSKTHQLGNRLRVTGEEGTLIVDEGQKHSVTFFPAHSDLRYEISGINPPPSTSALEDYFRVQLEDLVSAIRTGGKPKVDGAAGMRSVRLIEECYRQAVAIEEPWGDSTLARLTGEVTGVIE
jgi:predicted dehydrogenase